MPVPFVRVADEAEAEFRIAERLGVFEIGGCLVEFGWQVERGRPPPSCATAARSVALANIPGACR